MEYINKAYVISLIQSELSSTKEGEIIACSLIQKIYSTPSISLDDMFEYLGENADCPPDHLRCNYDCKECWKTALTELIKAVERYKELRL